MPLTLLAQKKKKSEIEPLTDAEIESCMRWARVWFLMARRARELEEWRMGDRFQCVGEEIFDRLEKGTA